MKSAHSSPIEFLTCSYWKFLMFLTQTRLFLKRTPQLGQKEGGGMKGGESLVSSKAAFSQKIFYFSSFSGFSFFLFKLLRCRKREKSRLLGKHSSVLGCTVWLDAGKNITFCETRQAKTNWIRIMFVWPNPRFSNRQISATGLFANRLKLTFRYFRRWNLFSCSRIVPKTRISSAFLASTNPIFSQRWALYALIESLYP